MTSYDLAKQLKDAGFPQGISRHMDDANIERIRMPSLSELIEACSGNMNFCLEEQATDIDLWWNASANGSSDFAYTPEEAVAKLWLALHEKKAHQTA